MKFNLSEINNISKEIIKYIESESSQKATVLALHGNLGAGKTTLTQNISKQLGVDNTVNSPTFVIQKRYEVDNSCFKSLIHIDAYRIESIKEMENLGFDKYLENKDNLIIIEWPENIKELLPDDSINLYLGHVGEEVREIRIERKGIDITTII